MDPLVAALVLILLALLGARFSFSTERVPAGPRLLFRTGIHFLVLGFVLGPAVVGLITAEAARQLFPFLALGLGWVGFHFGLQLHRDNLRLFSPRFYLVAFGQSILAFLIFLGGAHAVAAWSVQAGRIPEPLLMGGAAIAAVTAPAGIAMISQNFLVRGKVRDLLFFCGSLDALVGILALAVTYALYRPTASPSGAGDVVQLSLLPVGAGLGIVMGMVFIWLVRRRPPREELVLYVLGTCAFSGGIALQWGLSPLFVSVAVGATVANVLPDRSRVFALMQRWEKPVYLSFLLVAGALLQPPTVWVVPLTAGYVLLRALAKMLGGAAMVTMVPLDFTVPRHVGLGLIPQGGIALAMAVSGVLTYSDLEAVGVDAGAVLFAVVAFGVVISELVGPFLIVQLLRGAGELSPRVEAALAEGDHRLAEREALHHTLDRPQGGTET